MWVGSPFEPGGHDPPRAAVDEGLSQVALVEDEAAVHRGDAALVPAVLHPFPDPLVDPPRVEDPLRQGFVIVGRGETEDVGVEDELRPLPAAEGVPVDADDAGQRAAVGVERRGRVVGLHLEDEVPVVVEADDPGVVGKDGEAPVVRPHPLPDLAGRPLDAGAEKGVDLGDAPLAVVIGDPGVEDLVLAVFRPGLGEAFQLRVGHPGPQADLFAPGEDGVVFQVVPEDPHLLQGQGEDPLLADPDERLVGAVEVDLLRPDALFPDDPRHIGLDRLCRVPGAAVDDLIALDQIVGEEFGGDPLRIAPGEEIEGAPVADAGDRILPGGVDPDRFPGQQGDRLRGGLPHVVRDAGAVTHLDQPVETAGESPVDGVFLDDGIGERAAGGRFQISGGKVAVDGVHLDRSLRNPPESGDVRRSSF